MFGRRLPKETERRENYSYTIHLPPLTGGNVSPVIRVRCGAETRQTRTVSWTSSPTFDDLFDFRFWLWLRINWVLDASWRLKKRSSVGPLLSPYDDPKMVRNEIGFSLIGLSSRDALNRLIRLTMSLKSALETLVWIEAFDSAAYSEDSFIGGVCFDVALVYKQVLLVG